MRSTFFFIPVIALFAIGCSKGTTVVGKWKVDPEYIKANENMEPKGFMTGFTSTFWYDLKADKTFTGAMSEGTWALNGDTLTIMTTKVAGQDVEKLTGKKGGMPMTGTLSNGGKTLTLVLPSGAANLPAPIKAGIKMAKEETK